MKALLSKKDKLKNFSPFSTIKLSEDGSLLFAGNLGKIRKFIPMLNDVVNFISLENATDK